jgi:uncharacterized protein DUF1579
MRRIVIGLLCLFLFAINITAQTGTAKKEAAPAKKAAAPPAAGAPQMPQPPAELKRLAYYAGDWTSTGTMQASEMGPAGTFKGKEHNEWFPGKFFLVSHGDGTMVGMGSMKEMAIFGYNTDKKMYTYHAINSMGEAEDATGTVNGADWTWTSDSTVKGKSYKTKFTVHEDSPTAYTMKFDMSSDGGKTWKTAFDGKATKAAATK